MIRIKFFIFQAAFLCGKLGRMDTSKIEQISAETESLADDIVKKACGILEPVQRAVYVSERLSQIDEEQIAQILHTIFKRAAKRTPLYRKFLESGINASVLKSELGNFKFSRLYHFAQRNGFDAVVALFSSSPSARKSNGDEDMFLVYGASDRTVGERRFMARGQDKVSLDKVGYDLNPLVIRRLLQNPRMTEPDVIKIIARRPNTAEVLTEIAENKKWLTRYIVKLALASNPYTPPRLARSMLPFLLAKDLYEIKNDGCLSKPVREDADKLYRLRKDLPTQGHGAPDTDESAPQPSNVYKLRD
jgi:hypothetical protein